MRPVHPDPRGSSCFDLIVQWISQCKLHARCSQSVPVALPKRVIEISADPSISPTLRTSNDALGRYVVLSHCWGSKGPTKLTNALLAQFQEAIKLELLPKSFRDAIEITRRLHFRYLWIDALCIIQDNGEDWAQESGKMASYYGLSALMISATAAEDSSKGILNARNVLCSPMMGKEQSYCLCEKGLQSDGEINGSVLATRGWAAQERILAPRILHYTTRQMWWECAQAFWCEASDKEVHRQIHGAGYSKPQCQRFVTEALSQENNLPRHNDHNTQEISECGSEAVFWDKIRAWNRCVREFSSRSLTVPIDKLHAIAGVAKMLNQSGELGTYWAGIWSVCLADALNWKSHYYRLRSPPIYTAPTWTWAGLEGEVRCAIWIPQTSIDDAEQIHAKRFDPKLIDQHMILQDERNIYGAVQEGSYITIEGACLMSADFDCLMRDLYGNDFGGFPGVQIKLDRERLDMSAPYDCCMFLNGNLFHKKEKWEDGLSYPLSCMDVLLLSWVDQEAKVAQRVGVADMQSRGDRDNLIHKIKTADWERWTLELV
ncbi:unnamed protein product [Alternaria alternata]